MTGSSNWGLWSGLGQGLSNAGSIYASLTEAARQRALQAQALAMTSTQQQFGRDAAALQTYQETGQDLPGYTQGKRTAGGPGAIAPSPSSALQGDNGGAQPPTPDATTNPIPALGTGGVGSAPLPVMGMGPGNTTQSQRGSMPSGALAGALLPGGAPPILRALQSAAQGAAAGAGAAPSGSTPSFMPDPAMLASLSPMQRRQAVMMALQRAQDYQAQVGLKGAPPGVNPQEVALQTGAQQETARHNKAEEAISLEGIQKQLEQMKIMFGLRTQTLGESFGKNFAEQTKDDRKAGELAQQLDDAYGQATGATTPDHRPNPASLKSLVVNQIANTEPGMQVRLGTLMFNGLGGDMSLAGKLSSGVDVALKGLPPQEQIAALHGAAVQMIKTKAARYAKNYQLESQAHPDIPNYEQEFLRPTMAPSSVFGHYATDATGQPAPFALSEEDKTLARKNPAYAEHLAKTGIPASAWQQQ